MKKVIYPILQFFVGTLLVCCNAAKNDKLRSFDLSTSKTIEVPDIDKWTGCSYSFFATRVDYVPLEFTPNSIINRISQCEISKEGDIIVFDRGLKQILRFASDGHFLNAIGVLGHGANELISPVCIVYNECNNHLYVWDDARYAIVEFELNGSVIGKSSVQYNYGSMGVVDSMYMCFFSDYSIVDTTNGADSKCNYHIYSNAELAAEYEPYNQDLPYLPDCLNVFNKCDNRLFCKSPYSNLVCEVMYDSIVPRYRYEYEDRENWITDISEVSHSHNHDGVYCQDVKVSNRFLFGKIGNHELDGFAVTDLQNDITECTQNLVNDLETYGVGTYRIFSIHDDRIFAETSGFEVAIEFMKQDGYSGPILEKYRSFAHFENPILQIIDLKSGEFPSLK